MEEMSLEDIVDGFTIYPYGKTNDPPDIRRSQKLTLSTSCSGELKTQGKYTYTKEQTTIAWK